MKQDTRELMNIADAFQKDCHALTDELMTRHNKLEMQDATNVWTFKKLAEFEIRLRNLELDNTPR